MATRSGRLAVATWCDERILAIQTTLAQFEAAIKGAGNFAELWRAGGGARAAAQMASLKRLRDGLMNAPPPKGPPVRFTA